MEQMTAFDPRIVETLRVLIAPGGRMRLSPFVEEAQIKVLFREEVDIRSRFESIRRIINTEANRNRIRQIAKAYVAFINNRRSDEWQPFYRNELVRQSWLISNFSVNVCKVQMALLELVSNQQLSGNIAVIDIGIGAGNVPVAVMDFLIAWDAVCRLYDLNMPVTGISYYGFDVVEEWLQLTHEVINSYCDVLNRRASYQVAHDDSLHRIVEQFRTSCSLVNLDLNRQVPPIPNSQKIIVFACNVLSELDNKGQGNMMHLLRQLPQDSCAVIIEPGDQRRTQQLNRWRKEFLASPDGDGWSILAPCGQEFGRQLPELCCRCWNLRRDHFHETQLYRALREEADQIRPDRRSWDDYENNLLSQSYTILINSSLPSITDRLRLRRDQERNISGTARYIGTLDREDGVLLKLCPGALPNNSYQTLLLRPNPAIPLPKLQFGDIIRISGARELQSQRGKVVLELPEGNLPGSGDRRCEVDNLTPTTATHPPDGFLPDYTERTRWAIDELAYRFFGFEKMHDFQHDVLKRVLCGHSIFAIAATGGGKSECFILPALLLPGITIVVAPLKSLMQDQYEQRLRDRYGFGDIATYINGDLSFEEKQRRLMRMEKGYYKIVYFTPEQLERDYVLSFLRRAHENVGIRYIALDEAHCISQWGHDFRPSYLNIVLRLKNAGIHPLPVRIALTATASPKVREDVCRELELSSQSIDDGGDLYVHSSNRPELNFVVRIYDTTDQKVDDMIKRLRSLGKNDAAIVFLPLTGGNPDSVDWSRYIDNQGKQSSCVTYFASYLERALQERVCLYHSKMDMDNDGDQPETTTNSETPSSMMDMDNDGDQQENAAENIDAFGDLRGRRRRSEQEHFILGRRRIMVATKGFGMGIDKPNVRLVLHRTPPANLEAYIQEAGRAGRDGRFATVVLYFSADKPNNERSDEEIQKFFISEKYIRREDVDAMLRFLRSCNRTVNDTLYFTNDEIIDFFDRLEDYQWPGFPKPDIDNSWPSEHRKILERGHIYNEKTKYIRRILSAMYSFRPGGRGLLDYCQEVGIQVRNPLVRKPETIIHSNYYFGEIFRQCGLSPDELRQLIEDAQQEFGIIPLAQRLGRTLYEVHAMLQDMRTVGRVRNQEALLEFSGIFAPKYGPARGRNGLRDWLGYAGATRRASPEIARKRIMETGEGRRFVQQLRDLCREPRSEAAQQWIQAINENTMRRIGGEIKRLNAEGTRSLQDAHGIILIEEVFNRNKLANIELIYYREDILQRLGDRNIKRFMDMQRRSQFAEAHRFLRQCGLEEYEARFFSNRRIQCVGVNRTPNHELIVYLQDPLLADIPLQYWFDWDDCPRSVGWEVRLSEAFASEEQLKALVDAFMAEHDQRQRDDWNAYSYLLNDYIGVNNPQGSRSCLRAVMLGYLKTNEIVVGSRCYSCSNCVPDERFSTDLEQRRSVVQRLSQVIIDILRAIEQDYQDILAPAEVFTQLWELCQQEARRNRNVIPYLQGWSARILTDTPEHKSVHLLRAEAMYHGHWQMNIEEYRSHLERLCGLCTAEELRRIQNLYDYISENDIGSQSSLLLLADYYNKIGDFQKEKFFLERLCTNYPDYERLRRLVNISEQHQLADVNQLNEWRVQAARYAPDVEAALEIYRQVEQMSNLDTVLDESIHLLDSQIIDSNRQKRKAIALMDWYLEQNARLLDSSQILDLGRQWEQISTNYALGELVQPILSRVVDRLRDGILQLDNALREAAMDFIRRNGSSADLSQALRQLSATLQDEDPQARQTAFRIITGSMHPDRFQYLEPALTAPDTELQQSASQYLLLHGQDTQLYQVMSASQFQFTQEMLHFFMAKHAIEGIRSAFQHPLPRVRRLALWYAVSLNRERAVEYIRDFANDADHTVRRLSCRLAVKMGDRDVLRQHFLQDSDNSVARIAAIEIIRSSTEADRAFIARFLNHQDQFVAERAYRRLTPVTIEEVYNIIVPLISNGDRYGYLKELIRHVAAGCEEEKHLCFAKLFLSDQGNIRSVGGELLSEINPELYHEIERNRERIRILLGVVINYESQNDHICMALYDPDSWNSGYIARIRLPAQVLTRVWQKGTVGQAIVVEHKMDMARKLKTVGYRILALFNPIYNARRDQLKYWLLYFAPLENDSTPIVKRFEGRIRKPTSRRYGFVQDIFVPPHLATMLTDGEPVRGIAILGFDRSKQAASWEAIVVTHSNSNDAVGTPAAGGGGAGDGQPAE